VLQQPSLHRYLVIEDFPGGYLDKRRPLTAPAHLFEGLDAHPELVGNLLGCHKCGHDVGSVLFYPHRSLSG
jgi:hypothetical protein